MAKIAAVEDGENTLIMVGQQIKQEAQLLLGWPTHGTKTIFLEALTWIPNGKHMGPSFTDETLNAIYNFVALK